MIATYIGLAQTFSSENLVNFINATEELERYRIQLVEDESKNKM